MKFREIQRLRGYAVLLVILAHITLPFGPNLNGTTGVTLFFVISGFVVTLSLERKLPELDVDDDFTSRVFGAKAALKNFFTRRFFRIIPMAVFTVSLALFASIYLNSTHVWNSAHQILKEIFSIFTLTYNYSYPWKIGGDLGVFWSLNVEEHFYILLPLFLLAVPTREKRVKYLFFGIALIALVIRPFVHFSGDPIMTLSYNTFSSHNRFDALMAGVLVAIFYKRGFFRPKVASKRTKVAMKALAFYGMCVLLFFMTELPYQVYWYFGRNIIWAVSSILIVLAVQDQNYIFGTPVLGEFMEYVGERSYSIYLLHETLWKIWIELQSRFPAMQPYTSKTHLSALYFLYLFIIVELCYQFIEKPLIEVGKKIASSYQSEIRKKTKVPKRLQSAGTVS